MPLAFVVSDRNALNRIGAAMSTFAPEFSQYWMGSLAAASVDGNLDARDDDSRSQEAALQELAERVNAARSVV